MCRKYVAKGKPFYDDHFEELEEEGWKHGDINEWYAGERDPSNA